MNADAHSTTVTATARTTGSPVRRAGPRAEGRPGRAEPTGVVVEVSGAVTGRSSPRRTVQHQHVFLPFDAVRL
ncbi:Uncharacterised protein [Mycobacteroides abscessus]|nr:Uncharacterised protein [Mycobacteroides abscessus]